MINMVTAIMMGGVFLVTSKFLGWKKWGFLYPLTVPFFLLYQGALESFVWGLLLGVSFYFSLRKRGWWWRAGMVVLAGWGGWRLGGGVPAEEMVVNLGVINRLVGEHLQAGEGMLGRVFHNKLELVYFVIKSLEEKLGPVRLFAQGEWPGYQKNLLVGYFHWWDVYFLLRAMVGGFGEKLKIRWWGVVVGGGALVGVANFGGELNRGLMMGVISYLSLVMGEEINRLEEGKRRMVLGAGVVVSGLIVIWMRRYLSV